jgi:hypothetical protein
MHILQKHTDYLVTLEKEVNLSIFPWRQIIRLERESRGGRETYFVILTHNYFQVTPETFRQLASLWEKYLATQDGIIDVSGLIDEGD